MAKLKSQGEAGEWRYGRESRGFVELLEFVGFVEFVGYVEIDGDSLRFIDIQWRDGRRERFRD
jgi:hypothetical protein